MTDIYDQATEAEEQFRAASLAAQARKLAPAAEWEVASAKWCTEPACGVRIPDARRQAIPGVQLCVDCQELNERTQRQGRRGY